MDTWRTPAATNNAEWCDLVCRSHGARTRFEDDAWTSETRTPAYYPDAVTLVPDPSVPDLMARIDVSAGCSIKDSFASLDLVPEGFRVLFDAQWMVRESTARQPTVASERWERVRTPAALATWEHAWRGGEGPEGIFRVELLDHGSVAVLASIADERVVAGAILYRSSTVVGISNFFADPLLGSDGWSGCLAFADSLFPASTFVGYESGDALVAARRHGFETTGPLRVWVNEG